MAEHKYEIKIYTKGMPVRCYADDAYFIGNGAIFCYQRDNQRYYHSTANIDAVVVTLLEGEWEEDDT